MIKDTLKILKGCPEELLEEFKTLEHNSRLFLRKLDIDSDDNFDEIKIDLQEAKDDLFEMIGSFMTTLNLRSNIELKEDKKEDASDEIMMKWKFEQDVGEILASLKKQQIFELGKEIQLTTLLKDAGDFKVAFDFLIYQPIVRANKYKTKELKDYILIVFALVSANAGILGYTEKVNKVGAKIKPPTQVYAKILEKYATKKKEPTEKGEGSSEDDEEEGEGEEEPEEEEEDV